MLLVGGRVFAPRAAAGCDVARDGVMLEVAVELDLDVHEEGNVELRAELGGLGMLDVEVEEVEHGLHDGRAGVVGALLGGEGAYGV